MAFLNDVVEFGAPLGPKENPYCYRYMINFGLFALRLHKWVGNDPHMHSHPYWMFIFCLFGSYEDVQPDKIDVVKRWQWRFRKPSHIHKVNCKGAWTFLITGPKLHKWYLFHGGKKYHPEKYFRKFKDES